MKMIKFEKIFVNASARSRNLKFIEADAVKLTFGDGEFDLVLSVDALHHIPNRNKTFDEISRVLESNGFYVLVDIALPGFFGKFSIPVDEVINYMKRKSFKIIYGKKPPEINIIGRRFSIIFQI